MKSTTLLTLAALILSSGAGMAEPLNDKSKAPDWGRASQSEKDAWVAAFQFKKADADKAEVATCLDSYAGKPLFETNALTGVTSMCETLAELPR
jgi:hypothetical protein